MSTSLPSFYKKCFYESNAKIWSQQSDGYNAYQRNSVILVVFSVICVRCLWKIGSNFATDK